MTDQLTDRRADQPSRASIVAGPLRRGGHVVADGDGRDYDRSSALDAGGADRARDADATFLRRRTRPLREREKRNSRGWDSGRRSDNIDIAHACPRVCIHVRACVYIRARVCVHARVSACVRVRSRAYLCVHVCACFHEAENSHLIFIRGHMIQLTIDAE